MCVNFCTQTEDKKTNVKSLQNRLIMANKVQNFSLKSNKCRQIMKSKKSNLKEIVFQKSSKYRNSTSKFRPDSRKSNPKQDAKPKNNHHSKIKIQVTIVRNAASTKGSQSDKVQKRKFDNKVKRRTNFTNWVRTPWQNRLNAPAFENRVPASLVWNNILNNNVQISVSP